MRKIDVIDCISGIIGALGSAFIPVFLFIYTQNIEEQNRQLQLAQETQNRQLQIAQMTSQLYKADCQQKVDYVTFISTQFPEDISSTLPVVNSYLKVSDKKCEDKVEKEYNKQIRNKSIQELENYEIRIYYIQEYTELQEMATSIRNKLENYGVTSKINMYPKSQTWFNKQILLSNSVIFYEKGVEDQAGKLLQNVLSKIYPQKVFKLQDTGNSSSKNAISIMLK